MKDFTIFGLKNFTAAMKYLAILLQ